MSNITTSPGPGKLNWNDFLKCLLVAVISTPITIITTSINAGNLNFDWHNIGIVAMASGLSYIVKNFFTPAQITINNPQPGTLKDVKEGNASVKVISK